MDEEIPLKDKIDILFNQKKQEEIGSIKTKPIKVPRKAKVRRRKIKKGWVGVLRVDENGNISGEKQKIEDSSFTLKDGTYHATDGSEILFWEGKYPVIIQEVKKLNPVKVIGLNSGENQTYGQKYVMAKMLKDAIKVKSKGGGLLIWIVVAAVVFFGAKYIFKLF